MICGGLSVGAALLLNSYLVNAFLAKGMAPAAASGVATLLNVCLLIGGILSGIVVSKVGRYNLPLYRHLCRRRSAVPPGLHAAHQPPDLCARSRGGIIVSGSIGVNMARIPCCL